MRVPDTRQEAIDFLLSGCEQCLSCLNELTSIHINMDAIDRVIQPDDDEIVYRLRKVLLHVKSVASWQIDTRVIHVLAPESRAAAEQIDMVWKKVQKDQLTKFMLEIGASAIGERSAYSKMGRDILSRFVHPTPQELLLAREQGGLGNVDEILYYIQLLLLLNSLAVRYAVSLIFLSQLFSGKKEAEIASVITRIREVLGSMSPADYLRFVSKIDN